MSKKEIRRRGFLTAAGAAAAGLALPLPAGAERSRPSLGNRYELQRRFVDWRFGMFIHFNMGTFHDMEWVNPNQDPLSFNPTALDCGQWADAAGAAGMKFAVLTAKHHDGFCLWPSRYTTYDVMSSSYRHDVVREYVEAFRSSGVTPCLYFSIWDRTNGVGPPVWDEPAPISMELVKGQLTELLTRYGRIPLLIFDGWAWHPRLGHNVLPFGEIRDHVASLQPDCLVLDLNGLSVPWDSDLLFIEEPKGGVFCPPDNTYAASQGQTISPAGWFWHPSTPAAVLTPEQIVDGHLSVLEPRYCTFILNCPPNPRGCSTPASSKRFARSGRGGGPTARAHRCPRSRTSYCTRSRRCRPPRPARTPRRSSTATTTSAGTGRPTRPCGSRPAHCRRRSRWTWTGYTPASTRSLTCHGRTPLPPTHTTT